MHYTNTELYKEKNKSPFLPISNKLGITQGSSLGNILIDTFLHL